VRYARSSLGSGSRLQRFGKGPRRFRRLIPSSDSEIRFRRLVPTSGRVFPATRGFPSSIPV
jgi:hypothetical protein